MAEYYPLLDRAVSSLPEPTPEARQSIYERARGALLAQLRGMRPAIPEGDIQRESTALDEAIARIESRFPAERVSGTAEPVSPETSVTPSPAPPSPGQTAPAEPATAGRASAKARDGASPVRPTVPAKAAGPDTPPPIRLSGKAPAVPPPAAHEGSAGRGTAAPSVNGEIRATPPTGVRPPGATTRNARPVLPLRPTGDRDDPRGESPNLPRAPLLPAGAPDANGRAESASLQRPPVETVADFGSTLASVAGRRADASSAPDPVSRARAAPALRPAAPRPAIPRRFGRPAVVTGAAVVVLMVGIGIAAWRMRDRPEQVVASHPEIQVADGVAAGKVAERAPPGADAGTPVTADGGDPAVAADGSDANPAVPVAQRAALLINAPDEPQRVKTYTGTVVWHLDSVSGAPGAPLATAVRADIDIPDAKLKVMLQMQRNPEPQLPASHTLELHFSPQAGNVLGNVKQLNVPEMRSDEAASGDPLTGVPVAITENYFLVGLQRGASEEQNMRLLAERNWFDMTVLFSSSKFGKLTFEKGAAGERVFQDAMKAWR